MSPQPHQKIILFFRKKSFRKLPPVSYTHLDVYKRQGKDLAIITGEALKEIPFDLVITSPLKRARETGELIVAASEKNFGR